jgi:SAM-dependent methyltransferase
MTVAFAPTSPAPAAARCPLCGTAPDASAWIAPDGVRTAHSCRHCGLTYVWPRLEQNFATMPEIYFYHNFESLDLSGSNFLFADVSASLGRRIALGFDRGGQLPSILDAGCGAGHSLLAFRAHGWSVAGVDPWIPVTAAGRKYYRLPIHTGRFEIAEIAPGSKDVVLALDVLQFVADPQAFVLAALEALRPGGLLYMTVPNFGSAASRREGWKHGDFMPTAYLTYFTAETMRRLLDEAGFYRIQISLYDGDAQDRRLRVLARRAIATEIVWPDISEDVPDAGLPPLDRQNAPPASLAPEQAFWRENGYLVLKGLIPDDLIDRYCAVRRHVPHAEGWSSPTPYLDVPEIRNLCLYQPLCDRLEQLLGEPVGLHLNLTGWVSTERDWHQDDYLNPPEVNGHYIAVWMALDTIGSDAGPFEFVPGSHRWPIIRQEKMLKLLGHEDGSDPYWPAESERLLTPFFEDQIKRRGVQVERFLGNRGDVLIWHARLLHRGSLPMRPSAERRSIISHYSALTHRADMPVRRRHPGGGWYFIPGAELKSQMGPSAADTPAPARGSGPLVSWLTALRRTVSRPTPPRWPTAKPAPRIVESVVPFIQPAATPDPPPVEQPPAVPMPALDPLAAPEQAVPEAALPEAAAPAAPAEEEGPVVEAPAEEESPVVAAADEAVDWRYATDLGSVRAQLARRYIRGAGIEFGALDFPLQVPPDAKVTYADFEAEERVKYLFSVDGDMPPLILSDLETMRGIDDESQDFIIANHVFEHVEDPLKALRAIARVLRPNGIAYLAIPDKRYTFDKDRAITPLSHLLRDHAEGPDWSLPGHYEEWARCVDGLTGEAHARKVACMLETRTNIHFHVWDFAAMMALFAHVEQDESFGLIVENATHIPIEVVWILRKRDGGARDRDGAV